MDRARRIPSAESDTPRSMATKLERLGRADTHDHGFRSGIVVHRVDPPLINPELIRCRLRRKKPLFPNGFWRTAT